MSWAASVEIMLPPRGAADWSQAKVDEWRVGSVVAVYPLVTVDPVPMPRTGYVHVVDVPDTVTLDRFRAVLCEEWQDDNLNMVEPRLWMADPSKMVDPGKTALLQDRQVTSDWVRLLAVSWNIRDLRQATEADFA